MSASSIAAARLQRSDVRSPLAEINVKVCRFCQQPERPGSADGELIVPCNCQGGMRYVHLACLRKHQYAAARTGGPRAATFCNVCKGRYFVGYPSVSEAAQAKCDQLVQLLRPGVLLVASPDKQTSSGGAWVRTVILLTTRRRKDEVSRESSAWQLLDKQGGDFLIVGFVLTGGEWHPQPPPYLRMPLNTVSVRECRLPGGPVKSERALIHSVSQMRDAVEIPLLGEQNRGIASSTNTTGAPAQTGNRMRNASAAAVPTQAPLFLSALSAHPTIASFAHRTASADHPALILPCEGAACWTDAQLMREVIAGSWGVLPARAAHVWSVGDGAGSFKDERGLWPTLMRSREVKFATDVIRAADEEAAAAAAAAVPAAERAASLQRLQQLHEREAHLLRTAHGQTAPPQQQSPATQQVPRPAGARAAVERGGVATAPHRQVAACALPLHAGTGALSEAECSSILAAVGKRARFVLIGESSHGTQQFYEVRAQLTRLLIEKHGFQAVVVEGDWPDAQRVDRYVSLRSMKDKSAADALSEFGRRFPDWMWRNEPTAAFVEWLRSHNDSSEGDSMPVGFYGMDLYSLHHSARKVIEYLEAVDPPAAKEARDAYAVLFQFENEPTGYGRTMAQGQLRHQGRQISGLEVQKKLEGVLTQLQRRNEGKYEYFLRYTSDQRLDAEINAEVVVNGETYYRENWHQLGFVNTWNVRDQHMVQVLMRLEAEMKATLNAHGPTAEPKIVVWAHNSHIGDVRATDMHTAGGRVLGPKWSLGHLMRETFGRENVYSIGFSTYCGSVTAAPQWGKSGQCLSLNAGIAGSQEEVLRNVLPHVREVHGAAGADSFALLFSDRGVEHKAEEEQATKSAWERGDPAKEGAARAAAAAEADALLGTLGSDNLRAARVKVLRQALYTMRPQRAVGVAYKKDDELRAHYYDSCLPEYVDAMIHIDKTDALKPLLPSAEWQRQHAALTSQ